MSTLTHTEVALLDALRFVPLASVMESSTQSHSQTKNKEQPASLTQKPESEPVSDPLEKQVGGDHYKSLKIQPIEYIMANELGFCEGNVIKYITRYAKKGGVQDLDKVIHYIELLKSQLPE